MLVIVLLLVNYTHVCKNTKMSRQQRTLWVGESIAIQAKVHNADHQSQIINCFFRVQFFEPLVQFRHLLPQLGVPQLLKDVVEKECYKC